MGIPTTHVGSLPRPAEMIRRQGDGQELSAEELAGFVHSIVERQQSLGLSLINNGELPRADYVSATVRRIRGFDGSAEAPLPKDLEEVPEYARRFNSRNGLITLNPRAPVRLPACTSELVYAGEQSLRGELDMLTRAFAESRNRFQAGETALFFTAPSPGTIALFLANSYYPSYRAYLERLGEVLSREYQIINSYGVYLQVDCPDLAMGRHTAHKRLSDEEFLAIAELNIDVLNQALSGIEAERCRAHVCWGNYPGTHHCDIELAKIYPAIIRLKPRYLSLEASNHRHAHEAEIFERLPFPKDKVLMPGVIDTSSNTVEHPELVARRLLGFASALGPERLVGCTDCGFATTAAAASVSGEVAWMKLASLVEGAKLAGRRV